MDFESPGAHIGHSCTEGEGKIVITVIIKVVVLVVSCCVWLGLPMWDVRWRHTSHLSALWTEGFPGTLVLAVDSVRAIQGITFLTDIGHIRTRWIGCSLWCFDPTVGNRCCWTTVEQLTVGKCTLPGTILSTGESSSSLQAVTIETTES